MDTCYSCQAVLVLLFVLIVSCYDLTNAAKLRDRSTSRCDIQSSSRIVCGNTTTGTIYAKHECNQKKCCWQDAKNGTGVPSCFYSRDVLKPPGKNDSRVILKPSSKNDSRDALKSSSKNDNETILSWFDQFPWSNYATETLKQADEYDRGSNYPRVYYAIFAGRSKYLDIHSKYCDMLLRLNYITEVHLWDFTGNGWDFIFDNFENKNYLAKWSGIDCSKSPARRTIDSGGGGLRRVVAVASRTMIINGDHSMNTMHIISDIGIQIS